MTLEDSFEGGGNGTRPQSAGAPEQSAICNSICRTWTDVHNLQVYVRFRLCTLSQRWVWVRLTPNGQRNPLFFGV